MLAEKIRELLKNPTEENCRRIVELLNNRPKEDKTKPLSVRLGEANERMARGDCLFLEEVQELLKNLERWGLCR